jgi:hypothetical protein
VQRVRQVGVSWHHFQSSSNTPNLSGVVGNTLSYAVTLLEISTPTRAAKKYGNSQTGGDGQFFHTGSLGQNIWDGQDGMSASAIVEKLGMGRASFYQALGA